MNYETRLCALEKDISELRGLLSDLKNKSSESRKLIREMKRLRKGYLKYYPRSPYYKFIAA